jgi:hypothetical protein
MLSALFHRERGEDPGSAFFMWLYLAGIVAGAVVAL